MRKLIAGCFLLLAWFFIVVNLPKPLYVYTNREMVNPTENGYEYDVYCYREYANKRIEKEFLGHYQAFGGGEMPTRISWSTCK